MTSSTKLKEAFEPESKHSAFYTGGNIEWHGDSLYCQKPSNVSILNIEDGVVSKVIGDEDSEDADYLQTFTSDGQRLVTSHKSGLLKLWNDAGELVKMWKYIHKGPIAKLSLKGDRLASGGSDGVVRIWDLVYQACVLSLKGCQGVINVVYWHPTEEFLFASGDDGKILCWELGKGESAGVYDAHYSKVTDIAFANDCRHFVSSGRDKVIVLWEFGKFHAIRTIAVYEAIESLIMLPVKFKIPDFKGDANGIYVLSGGENAFVKVWDVLKSKQVYEQTNSLVSKSGEEGGLAITKLLGNDKVKTIAVVSAEQNIILHSVKSFVCIKQFIGFSDEILDIALLGKNDSHIAVATNSADIKVYDNASMNCQLLKGHTDLVLALNTSRARPNLLISCGKDNQMRLWLLNEDCTINCVGIGSRHTGSVGSAAFANLNTNFAVSVSQDTCLKLWEIPEKLKENCPLNCSYTEVAHQKDINCVAVSPNDKIIATASQDKTAKLWTDSLTLVGVLRGHKRGVWCIRFSPVDQVVMTSSADCTIKLWSVAELSCLKTLEGHESSVLRCEFVSNGMQIISAGADGLLKLFSLKSSECICTMDEHEGKIWALTVKKDESGILTGGSDSLLVKWKDVTEERREKRLKEEEELILQEQKLNNYIQNNELLKALKLALRLDRPFQVLKIIQGVIKKGDSGLEDTIRELKDYQKESLLKCATNWNMNSKNCHPAQLVINILINELQTGDFRPVGLRSTLEGALPYTERHFKRLTQLLQDVNFITYTLNVMQPHARNVT